jgi:glycosyltransferase involved in cell wall biosynthesis
VRPKVSVVMSVYNGEKYLREAIESILNQTFTDFEFIIIDDSSSDSTSAILAEYASQDARLIIIRNDQNIGLTRSLNKGLAVTQGEYIARQDADDVSFPQRLQQQVNFLDNHPEVVLVSSNYEIIDAQGRQIKQVKKSPEPLLIAWYLLFINYLGGHSVVMFRREPVINLGGYAEDYRYAQDYQLWLQLLNIGDMGILPEVLLRWRSHEQNISSGSLSAQIEFALMAAQCNMKQLIGFEFNLAETMELWRLWSNLPLSGQQFNRLHTNLKIIYQAFLAHRQRDNDLTLSRQLCFLISRQLLYCARSSSLTETLWLKLIVLPYALAWHPLAVFDYWLKVVQKLIKRRKLHPV